MRPAAPALLLGELSARFRVGRDALGSRIEIGVSAAVRPTGSGRITSWMHEEGTNPESFRRDVDLLKAVIKGLIGPDQRYVFKGMQSTMRARTLEAICEMANEIIHAGEVDRWIGKVQ